MLLSTAANQVLQEFGGTIPENLLSFEGAKREFMSVRALELQKLGIASTDITVVKQVLTPSSRDEVFPGGVGADIIPAFVEVQLLSALANQDETRYKVEIIPVELIPAYEGARVIAFYGLNPKRYRLGWDAWNEGELTLWYDTIEDLLTITGNTDLAFPQAFWTFIVKKTALNLIRIIRFKLAYNTPSEIKNTVPQVTSALNLMEQSMIAQVAEWQMEFRKYLNIDLNTQPHLRRTNDEIKRRDYNNVTGAYPGEFDF